MEGNADAGGSTPFTPFHTLELLHGLIKAGVFNQAQVEQKGLQIGLECEPGAGAGVSRRCRCLPSWAAVVR